MRSRPHLDRLPSASKLIPCFDAICAGRAGNAEVVAARAIATAGVIIGTGQVSAIDLQAEAGVEWLPCERCVHDVEPLLPEAIVRFLEDMRIITDRKRTRLNSSH